MASSGWLTPYQTLTSSGFGYSYFKGAIYINSITRSGTTVTVSAKFGVYNDGGVSSYYYYPINAKVRDVTNFYQVVGGGVRVGTNQWVETGLFTFTLTVPVATTTANITIDWLYNNGYNGNTIVYTLSFDSGIPTPDLTGIGVTTTTATVGWFVDDGVGSLNGTGYIYGGTTASPTTELFTTTLKNDTFVDTGLTPNTQYYYRGRIKDTNDNWGPYTPLDLRLTTLQSPGTLYGSVNGQTKKMQKLYGSVSTTVIEYIVTRIANNPNLNLATFNSAFRQQYPSLVTKAPSYLTFSGTTSNGNITMRFSDNSTQQLARWTSLTDYNQVCSFWGFRSQDGVYSGSVTSSSQAVVKHFSKEITKLYGSVNGQTKLIYSK